MFQNYAVTAWRNLARHKLFAAINIGGLSIGLAACLLILLFVRHELSYNAWLPDAERVYKLVTRFDMPGRAPLFTDQAPGPAAPALKKEFPDIEAIARIVPRSAAVGEGDRLFRQDVHLVDAEFFAVFDIPLIAGDRTKALADTSSLVLAQSAAARYFGGADPLGRTLTLDDGLRRRDFRVTGVFADLPVNSTFKLEVLGLFDPLEYAEAAYIADMWTAAASATYLKLRRGAAIDRLAAALPAFERRNIRDSAFGGQTFDTSEMIAFRLIGLRDVRLFARPYESGQGDIAAVLTACAVAVLILAIACINFVNLATARASQRAREVGLRKALGASRHDLVLQFLGETLLLAAAGLAGALILAELALPAYGELLGTELEMNLFGTASVLPWAAALILVVGLAGGLYPALYLSRFRPARVLKCAGPGDSQSTAGVRSVLVVAQFAISIALIVCTGVVHRQALYAKSLDLGFAKENMIVVRGIDADHARRVSEALRQEVAKLPGVIGATRSSAVPGDLGEANSTLRVAGPDGTQTVLLGRLEVEHDFFDTYRVAVVAGRDFAGDRGDDASNAGPDDVAALSVMINERAVKRLGFGTPEEAVGREVGLGVSEDGTAAARIVGVVADFHHGSVREEIRPTFYLWNDRKFAVLSVRFSATSGSELMSRVESLWRQIVPDQPFRGEFLDQRLAEQYAREEAQGALFAAFSALAVLVACLGLYGLAAFSSARRTREIGIRKAMGAKAGDIVALMVWQFSKPVLLANLIAWPAAYLLMRDWLSAFAYRIELDPAIFAAAGLSALSVAWATVAGHAFRAARFRVADALRYE